MPNSPTFNCIAFDPTAREIVLTAPLFNAAVDFQIISNPSTQNGDTLLLGKAFNLQFPIYGIGIQGAINGTEAEFSAMLSAWKQQCKNDGATLASYTMTNEVITTKISYL